jgi:hypothetical protein
MRQLAIFLALTAVGWVAGYFTNINPIEETFFPTFAAFALTLGLYGSVAGIDLEAIRSRRFVAIIVITVAVPLQILVAGGLMYLIYPVGISFLLAVALTQIDPLSVDTLLKDKERMSNEAKGLLRVWASFDDPVTVLFGFLILLPLVTGQTAASAGFGTSELVLYLLLNTIPALLIWLVKRYTAVLDNQIMAIIVLVAVLALAFTTQSYLLAAIVGLLLHPIPNEYLTAVISVFYYFIVFIVGMSIFSYGVDLRLGFLIAIVEFWVIQPATTLLVFNGKTHDVLRIAFAQQNGLTTLLMGIAFQSLGIPVLHILLPGIVFVNLFNLIVNRIYTYKEQNGLIY